MYAASRGEYLKRKIMAKYLGYEFVDAANVIRFNKDGSFDSETTNELLATYLDKIERAVIPGFYGAMKMVQLLLSPAAVPILLVLWLPKQSMRICMRTGQTFPAA